MNGHLYGHSWLVPLSSDENYIDGEDDEDWYHGDDDNRMVDLRWVYLNPLFGSKCRLLFVLSLWFYLQN